MKIEDAELSQRTVNVLKRAGIDTAEELRRRDEAGTLSSIDHFGKKSRAEVDAFFAQRLDDQANRPFWEMFARLKDLSDVAAVTLLRGAMTKGAYAGMEGLLEEITGDETTPKFHGDRARIAQSLAYEAAYYAASLAAWGKQDEP